MPRNYMNQMNNNMNNINIQNHNIIRHNVNNMNIPMNNMNMPMNYMNNQINMYMPMNNMYIPMNNMHMHMNNMHMNNMNMYMNNMHMHMNIPFQMNPMLHMHIPQNISNRIAPNIINILPESKIEDESKINPDKKECVICLEEFKNGEFITSLPCIHFFHSNCIKNWLTRNNECPVCKFKITNETFDSQ